MAEEPDEENVIQSEEASAGEPQKPDPAGTRRRAETSGMLSEEELNERQARIRTERRTGGPDLTRTSGAEEAEDEEPPDDPPTETLDPPEPP